MDFLTKPVFISLLVQNMIYKTYHSLHVEFKLVDCWDQCKSIKLLLPKVFYT